MTPALIRAARGLLNWSQQDLAKAAKLALLTVNKFERNPGAARQNTLSAMMAALQDAGVEFLANGGVRSAQDVSTVQRFSGDGFIEKLNGDIYAAVRKPGEEIFTCSTDESQWFRPGVKKASQRYYEWREKMGVRELYLVTEGNPVFESPRQNYRGLPEEMIGKITYILYADRMATVVWPKKQVFIMRGQELVAPFRQQFKFLWRMAKKI